MELGVLQLELLYQRLYIAGLIFGIFCCAASSDWCVPFMLHIMRHVCIGVRRERHPVVGHERQWLRHLDEVLTGDLADAAHAAHGERNGGLVLDHKSPEVAAAAGRSRLDHAAHHAALGWTDVGDDVRDAGLVDDHLAGQLGGERVVRLAEHVAGAQELLDASGLDGLGQDVFLVDALVAVRLRVLQDGLEADHGAGVVDDLRLGGHDGELLEDHAHQRLIGEFFE